MTTATKSDTSILEELDYDVPCCRNSCNEKAVVLMTLKHSQQGCPGYSRLLCQHHYERKIDAVANWLNKVQNIGGVCAVCQQHPSLIVSNNITAVWFH